MASEYKILISACLLGQHVRYDGRDNLLDDPRLQTLMKQKHLIPFCPECAGGLPVPRPACERQGQKIKTKTGSDHTDAFEKGADLALELIQQHGIKIALMKERSPSCGVHEIYDGSFNKTRIAGQGLTTERLKNAGVRVFSDQELNSFFDAIAGDA